MNFDPFAADRYFCGAIIPDESKNEKGECGQ
jgi:hypothetical protein